MEESAAQDAEVSQVQGGGIADEEEFVVYEGQWQNDLPHGEGTLRAFNN
jgi:hypothetical protein